jgi:hypothetical protein
MNVKLTPHAAELLKAARAHRQEPTEQILEEALEVFVRQEHIHVEREMSPAAQRQAVSDMLDFLKQNRVHLGRGSSVKEFIHEGHRV